MDIRYQNEYPSGMLSNLHYNQFIFDGILCNSMEGLLQSFKFSDVKDQRDICLLSGYTAKKRGYHQEWSTLYWNGEPFDRHDEPYQQLLDRAFYTLYTQNTRAHNALLATGNEPLTHGIGKTQPQHTILTRNEFCIRLMIIRSEFQLTSVVDYHK